PRRFTRSISDLRYDWFESPQRRGVLSVSGVIGTWAGPRSAGTAYVMTHHKIGDALPGRSGLRLPLGRRHRSRSAGGELGAWGFPRGGMGGVTRALRDAAASFGATVRT